MSTYSKRILGIAAVALGVLLLIVSLVGRGTGGVGRGMMGGFGGIGTMMGGGMMGGGLGGMFILLLFWALVIAILVTLFTWLLTRRQQR